MRWYREAALEGSQEAQNALGEFYDDAPAPRRDPEEAVRWFRMAAEQGGGNALYRLGLHHEAGDGVAADPPAAFMYFSLALQRQYPSVREDLEALRRALDPAQLETARRMLAEWTARHCME